MKIEALRISGTACRTYSESARAFCSVFRRLLVSLYVYDAVLASAIGPRFRLAALVGARPRYGSQTRSESHYLLLALPALNAS
jgi:hypothetical protein